MVILLLTPVIFSFLLLGAHFLRESNLVMLALCLLMPLLLLIPRWWVVRVIQASLLIAAIVWLNTTIEIVKQRQIDGENWIRAAVIFGAVVLWTLASGLVFMHPKLKRRYRPG